jgi:hypothetical protein
MPFQILNEGVGGRGHSKFVMLREGCGTSDLRGGPSYFCVSAWISSSGGGYSFTVQFQWGRGSSRG